MGDLVDGVKWVLSLYYYTFGAILGFWLTLYRVYVRETTAVLQWLYDVLFGPGGAKDTASTQVQSVYNDTKPKFDSAVNEVNVRLRPEVQNSRPRVPPPSDFPIVQRVK